MLPEFRQAAKQRLLILAYKFCIFSPGFQGGFKCFEKHYSTQFPKGKEPCRELPTGKTWPIVGSLPTLIAYGASPKLHLYIHNKHLQLGPVFREKGLGTSFVFLSDPIAIRSVFSSEGKYPAHFLPEAWKVYNAETKRRRGLLFMDGEEWWHYRRMLNQILMKDDFVHSLEPVHKIVVKDLMGKWTVNRQIDNLERDLYVHSLSFMLSTAMGSSYEEHRHKYSNDLEELGHIFQDIFATTSSLMLVPIRIAKGLHLPVWKQFCTSMDKSLSSSENLIQHIWKDSASDGLLKKLVAAGVNEEMIKSLLTDLFIAAGDTTSYTTQWALYLIGQKCTTDQSTLPVKGVLKEALRLYPAAPFLTRILSQPLTVCGYLLNPQEVIVMSMYSCGRTESYFPHAEQFLPERWERNKGGYVGVKNPSAFLPFAMGIRSCVGRKLAEAQLNFTLSETLKTFEIQTNNKVDMVLKLIPAPSDPIKLSVQMRSKFIY